MKRGSDAAADNEERARLRLRAEVKIDQKHDMQDVLGTPGQDEDQARAGGVRSVKARNLSRIWRKR